MPKITIDTDLIDVRIAQLMSEIEQLRRVKNLLPEMVLDNLISIQKKISASDFILQHLAHTPSGASAEGLSTQYAVHTGKSKFEIKSVISSALSRLKSSCKIAVTSKSDEGWDIYRLME